MNRSSPPLLGWALLAALAWLLLAGGPTNESAAPGPRLIAVLRETGDNNADLAAVLLQLRMAPAMQPHEMLLLDHDDPHPFVRELLATFDGAPSLPAIVIGRRTPDGLVVLHHGPCPASLAEILSLLQKHGG
ncbi:hypothetical protein [Lignipirellula cremea]|uniref:Uncharacterized protein n=1 Tax=Lignipirellula cremea TaxID=2528010 RepID=A0A518E0E3_9BACT|nr:hypothetical protein [Lignipirellula cremea]QDU97539.1 hypothetical protein Pla8534_53870 [Lignipirellula cremea]